LIFEQPSDTHVCDIAERDFGNDDLYKSCESKTLTPSKRQIINDCFVKAFGIYAGWAHCLLFAAELIIFEKYLPNYLIESNKKFKMNKKEKKAMEKKRKKDMKNNQKNMENMKNMDSDMGGVGGVGGEKEGSPEKKRKGSKKSDAKTPKIEPKTCLPDELPGNRSKYFDTTNK